MSHTANENAISRKINRTELNVRFQEETVRLLRAAAPGGQGVQQGVPRLQRAERGAR